MNSASTCDDVDECSTGDHYCGRNLACNNTVGSFACLCQEGYKSFGNGCVNLDECSANTLSCPTNSTCYDTEGSFECKCNSGLQGPNCDDFDECSNGTHMCHQKADCENVLGSYKCKCKEGFFGAGKECYECDPGYELLSAGISFSDSDSCVDKDECSGNNACSRNSECFNTVGSYECSCLEGFFGNGTFCKQGQCRDEDHCTENEDGYLPD